MDHPGADPDATLDAAVATKGPLTAATANQLLERGRERLDAGDLAPAFADFQRVVGHEDPAITAAALLGSGDALYRLDQEAQAAAQWEAVTRLRENPSTYTAWRNLAGVRVRGGDLQGAIAAYREADRRAPTEDRAEIASRLGWLAKETGNTGAANRYFARSRGSVGLSLTLIVIGITTAVSLFASSVPGVTEALWLERSAIQNGELYRLASVTLVHAGLLHLGLNMYALWIIGPIVEQAWGRRMFVLFYLLTAVAASTTSFILSVGPAVGASGAIFGLIGVVLAGTRAHHPILDRRSRQIVPQLGMLVILNLVIGFAVPGIDNAAHIGGLISGLWLGFVVPPGKVPTLRSAWQHPTGGAAVRSPLLISAGVIGLVAVVATALAVGGATL
ncbi:MAG TPA: rhomboid family intramembrane serine protease [Candidatus Dormibacteraeota bacterium]|nr:rhomboid family intramembrane serine protease [Candidatus Dormibacteraeota bacterium]